MKVTLKQEYEIYIREMSKRQGLPMSECRECYPFSSYKQKRATEILSEIRETARLYNQKALDSLYREYSKAFVTQLQKFALGELDWYVSPDIRTQPKWG